MFILPANLVFLSFSRAGPGCKFSLKSPFRILNLQINIFVTLKIPDSYLEIIKGNLKRTLLTFKELISFQMGVRCRISILFQNSYGIHSYKYCALRDTVPERLV